MKVETDHAGKLEVPEVLLKDIKELWGLEGPIDPDYIENEILDRHLRDGVDGQLVPQEVAEFYVSWIYHNVPFYGGYPRIRELEIEVDGRTIVFKAFFWTGEVGAEPEHSRIHAVAYEKAD